MAAGHFFAQQLRVVVGPLGELPSAALVTDGTRVEGLTVTGADHGGHRFEVQREGRVDVAVPFQHGAGDVNLQGSGHALTHEIVGGRHATRQRAQGPKVSALEQGGLMQVARGLGLLHQRDGLRGLRCELLRNGEGERFMRADVAHGNGDVLVRLGEGLLGEAGEPCVYLTKQRDGAATASTRAAPACPNARTLIHCMVEKALMGQCSAISFQ